MHTGRERPPSPIGWCAVHGKFLWETRKMAKRHARAISRTDNAAFRCEDQPRFFHLGHLPARVVHGEAGRETITPRRS